VQGRVRLDPRQARPAGRGDSRQLQAPGIQLRLDRLEAAEAVRSRLLWIIAGSVVSLAVAAVWKLVIGG